MTNRLSKVQLKVTDIEHVSELAKLSTVNLIIWIIGRSSDLNLILSLEDITLEAWLINPKKHSLRGYSQFPDSFNVIKRVYDMKGRNGWLEGTSTGGFKLSQKAKLKYKDIVIDVLNEGTKILSNKLGDDRTISSIDEAPYKRLIKTPAYLKFVSGKKNEIVETDYLQFFGVNWHQKPAYIEGKIKNVELVVDTFKTKDEVLNELHKYLIGKFESTKNFLLK
ncbi:hypothetical protein [Salegentibacter salegens]|uniref:Uncharacterized protein n=1 Tax=Salegentibacter salegens TaxID=143223 RepID=A0A1M7L8R7_9FLAO|nr:hypothetical protein [Salegentibacter salegens]PRX40777.1 hypothetical protein LY58_03106 [Salegentibacter salegens]SHM74286.1 hypothetical protein SAMN05878281_1795 [Salegentibacter salegens]